MSRICEALLDCIAESNDEAKDQLIAALAASSRIRKIEIDLELLLDACARGFLSCEYAKLSDWRKAYRRGALDGDQP